MLMKQFLVIVATMGIVSTTTAMSNAPEIKSPISVPVTAQQLDARMDSLVTVHWLHGQLDSSDLVLLDATVQINFTETGEIVASSGRDHYLQEHIPNAQFADLTDDLVDTDSAYDYAIPTPEKFAMAMAALGVSDDSRVVIYSSGFSSWAARVWWMLRWIGFDKAAVLDGGLEAWVSAGYPLEAGAVNAYPGTLSIDLRPNLIAERDEVAAAIEDDQVLLIDAMPEAHYRGEMVMYGRAGHIPTAVNVPTVFEENGLFMPEEQLVQLHPFEHDVRVITYCGGGISASANAFAMHRLGFTDLAVYMNSLDEWAADPDNPLIVPE